MIHYVGYSALILNLISMAMNNVIYLRLFSLVANTIYIVYGILLNAPPFIIGCSIAVMIHAYHLQKLMLPRKLNDKTRR